MKKIISLLLIVTIFYSCNSSSSKSELKKPKTELKKSKTELKKSKTELDYEMADYFLEYDTEKIGLLSIIKNVPPEKANSVLRDYLAKTLGSNLPTMESLDFIVKVVDTIAQKNNLPRKLTASIIFSYQYEMITRDEIIEEARDEIIEEARDEIIEEEREREYYENEDIY